MAFGLLKYGLSRRYPGRRFLSRQPELKSAYDVVIIGGGGHGLACAYYLAKHHGVRNVAVLEKGYIGGGNTGRNTAIIRSNYLTPEGVAFYDESVRLFQGLSEELDFNILYSERGHFTLAHTDAAMRTSRWRAEVNKHLGVNSEVVYRDDTTGRVQTVTLVYPNEADIAKGKASVLTPIGTALIGLAVGRSINWRTRTGDMKRLTVLQVREPSQEETAAPQSTMPEPA